MRDEEPHTSVVVPSITLDQAEMRKLAGASFYEERLLFLLIRLRNPRARVVFVTSQPVHPLVLEYYFQLLVGIPTSHARSRLTLLCAHDASPRPLTQKILERPRLIERIRQGIADRDIETALVELKRRKPGLRSAVVKLNESFSGEGNALFCYPEPAGNLVEAVHAALPRVAFSVPSETWDEYAEKFRRMGGIAEELLEAPFKTSPSVQLRSDPHGAVIPISTHDQILGGPGGQVFLGCLFPAADAYRTHIHDQALRIGAVLAAKGVVSRFGIDFLLTRDDPSAPWKAWALEINLRMGGTTHPYLALQFLTSGQLDPQTGLFHSPRGSPKFYRATDNLQSETLRGLLPEDLIEIVTINSLHYSHNSESGVLFHLIGALSEYGKLGMTAIGNTREEVEAIYGRTLRILGHEAGMGR